MMDDGVGSHRERGLGAAIARSYTIGMIT
jgi:hypothetical protein